MRETRINTLIECLYSKKMISKKYKIFYQNQYEYLKNSELLKKMGITIQNTDVNEDFIIDKNDVLKHYNINKQDEIRGKFKITDFDYIQFKRFKNSDTFKVILSLVNNNKIVFLTGLILKILLVITLYLIMSNLTTIVDTALVLDSKYIFETCALVVVLGVLIFCVIYITYKYVCKLIVKRIILDKVVYIEDEKYSLIYEQNSINIKDILQSFCNNLIDLFSLGIILIILYFFGNAILKFCLLQVLILIILNILFISSLRTLGFYDYARNIKRINEKSNDLIKIELLKNYKRKEKLCLIIFKLFFVIILFEIYMYLSYQIFNDALSLGVLIFNFVFIILLIYPFYDILCNIPNYAELIIFLRENIEDAEEQTENINNETIVFIKSPIIQLNNVTFGYDNNIVLNNVSLDIKGTSIIEIFGSAGSGKKTLVKLIMKERLPYYGDILIDGINTRSINNNIFKQLFEYVTFCYDFLGMSIRDYLLIDNDYSQTNIDYILEKIHFLDFLKRYPDYIDTIFIKKDELSNSEIAFLLIAKAIFNDKKIVILDNLFDFINDDQLDNLMNVFTELEIGVVFLENHCRKHDRIQKYYRLSKGVLKEENI